MIRLAMTTAGALGHAAATLPAQKSNTRGGHRVIYTMHQGERALNEIGRASALVMASALFLTVGCQSSSPAPAPIKSPEAVAAPAPTTTATTTTAIAITPPKPKSDSCALPSQPAASLEETAWRLFVAANCKNAQGQLTWETWQTQACLNQPNDCSTAGRLHGSLLAQLRRKKLQANDGPARTAGCVAMTISGTAPKQLLPFVPTNLSAAPVFCEEVTVNPAEYEYGQKIGLLSVPGQMKDLKAGQTIAFPTDAIEIKADWVPAASFSNATFDCAKPSRDAYLEEIQGTCYALAGIHISSKLYPNWLWATFEPQFAITNPNRCKADLYGSCNDTWGSNPATSTGQNTEATAALATLFEGAGAALNPSFRNYRLTGVQINFPDPQVNKGQLGSSFVEFNADVLPGQASCITCHSYAQRTLVAGAGFKVGQTPPGAPFTSTDHWVGTPSPAPKGTDFKPLDFSWFLGFGVPK